MTINSNFVRSKENTINQHKKLCSKMNVLYLDTISYALESNNVAINDTFVRVQCSHCDSEYNINYDRAYDLCKLSSLQHHFVKNYCPTCAGYKVSKDEEGINKSVSDWQKSYLWSLFSKRGSLVKSNANTREDDTYLCEHFSGNEINYSSEHLPLFISYENLKKHARRSFKLFIKDDYPNLSAKLSVKATDVFLFSDLFLLGSLNVKSRELLIKIFNDIEKSSELNHLEKELLMRLNNFEHYTNSKIVKITKKDYLSEHIPMLCCNTDYRKNGKTLTDRIVRHRAFDRKYRNIEKRTRVPNIWYEEDETIRRCCGDKTHEISTIEKDDNYYNKSKHPYCKECVATIK